MYFSNAAAALNGVMTSHIVLRLSNTRKYVMAVLTRIQGKLCDKTFICFISLFALYGVNVASTLFQVFCYVLLILRQRKVPDTQLPLFARFDSVSFVSLSNGDSVSFVS